MKRAQESAQESARFRDLVSNVVDAGLCSGCGTCVAVCPSNLRMKLNQKGEYVPEARAE